MTNAEIRGRDVTANRSPLRSDYPPLNDSRSPLDQFTGSGHSPMCTEYRLSQSNARRAWTNRGGSDLSAGSQSEHVLAVVASAQLRRRDDG
jgi:hypothetical protein